MVSFGTTYGEALAASIEKIEVKIQSVFPDYDVRRAFTSRQVIKTLAERDGIQIDTEKEALERLQKEKYQEVIIQPLHVVVGEEYDKIKWIVSHYVHTKKGVFDQVSIGRPLLYYIGREDKPDDYLDVIQALKQQVPPLNSEEAVVFMGHGGLHPANTAYAALQMKMAVAGFDRFFIYTVEGFPGLEVVIDKLKKQQIKKVYLMPFLLTAGNHVQCDMAGDEETSAKSQLGRAGFEVAVDLRGIGENEAIQELYIQHLRDAMRQTKCHKNHQH